MTDERTGRAFEAFETHRARLRSAAYHTFGTTSDTDDAVQEARLWLRSISPDSVESLGGWRTMVVAQVCLMVLQSRRE